MAFLNRLSLESINDFYLHTMTELFQKKQKRPMKNRRFFVFFYWALAQMMCFNFVIL